MSAPQSTTHPTTQRRAPGVRVPIAAGLYDPSFERDACGLAAVATLNRVPEHRIVQRALEALRNLEHRGAVGADADTGDGAGILTGIPDRLFRESVDFELPPLGRYGVGTAFLPTGGPARRATRFALERIAAEERLTPLGWREVPTRTASLGSDALATMPALEQLFLAAPDGVDGDELERRLFRTRKRAEREANTYWPSLSSRTLVTKGMMTTGQLAECYPDLSDERFTSRFAIVHSRYSTNTFPSWHLAQPLRTLAHNGEINTVAGNRNWMRARESQLASPLLGDLAPLLPVCSPDGSDSASLDEVLELLMLGGRSLPHALLMLVPEAWEANPELSPALRDFYEYHSLVMEPWDGPAAITATDGRLIAATLDRNGLRPGRTLVTDDGLVVLASETGVVAVPPETVIHRGRLRPGELFLIDTEAGRIIGDAEIKTDLAASGPWGQWLDAGRIRLGDLPEREHLVHPAASITRRQRAFGVTEEELRLLIGPMAQHGAEPLAAMGSDTPIAVLAERPHLLFDYFVQRFAQVTNPPLDALREERVTSLRASIGPRANVLEDGVQHARQVVVEYPVLDNDALAKIQHFGEDMERERTVTLRCLFRFDRGPAELGRRVEELCREAEQAVDAGAEFLILSDRDSTKDLAPVPSLLATSAVHHHLIRAGKRTRAALIVEAGDAREVHHISCLIGYGATAVNPYLALETAEYLVRSGDLTGLSPQEAGANLVRALGTGLLKVMSKMGISTVTSYCGAQTFESLGLDRGLIDAHFTGTPARLGGVGLDVLTEETLARHRSAYPEDPAPLAHERLDTGGEYQWRRGGPPHLFDPETIYALQHATREGREDVFRAYTHRVNAQAERLMTLRGLFRFRPHRPPVPLDEVEPVAEIVKRFSTGAMSYGSISPEAHETLAIAMNTLGGKSNTGEGGESVERLLDPERRSAIKQVASGRFGVTSLYLTHADDLQIKLAQGAKPGEGGQLPPGKMYPWIAETRNATPGVGLISPPPHHDIYSIEDLKQLIYDLKRANPAARIHAKLVSQSGIGAVSAGVAKALADVILVSGHDGGTGASPMNSLKHAGTPWELGLAETQQTLIRNGLRERVVLQVDGQLKTGRDVVIGALLGAEEFGFATAPLVVSGCVMMRVCHLDTCPVGVATQKPELRARYTGQAQHVINFFRFLAQEVRELLAELGHRSLAEAIGDVESLDADPAISHWKASGLDLTPVLSVPDPGPRAFARAQEHGIAEHFDARLIRESADALDRAQPVIFDLPIRNTDRAVGTMLGNAVTRRYGAPGLPPECIDVTLRGSAGQSLGAFLPRGIVLRLTGDANDYVGKGLSGGQISVRPWADPALAAPPGGDVIAGNVIGYGATAGRMFFRGAVGERFLVRNSGAEAVCEGAGDHALEYMTGGTALILGPTGMNLGAGMSGGTAYVLDLDPARLNPAALAAGDLIVGELDAEDRLRVAGLLLAHAETTGSPLVAELLGDPGGLAARMRKIEPRAFTRVRALTARAIARGERPDSDRVWSQILEERHG